MSLLRLLLRLVFIAAGAVLAVVLFLVAIVTFATLLIVNLLRGRKPDVAFRMNRNPWAQRRPPSQEQGDVVDVEVREVSDNLSALPLQPPVPRPSQQPQER